MLIIMPELVISGIFFALNWGQSVTDDAKASKKYTAMAAICAEHVENPISVPDGVKLPSGDKSS
ncbi:hypothetical protein JV210_03920 [Plesiomonas shigelloides]|uniref:hypothetical protein n=1 Tax=Plesiomonas TaxID=702 RepID=UPI0006487FD7|nr:MULTISPECIES: hypothetical protein [Plesiomonas]KAB7661055.1 hypothetical protein GBN25_15455 [Plesiomonas shigelloides]KAB7677712.1 hypothetical protein GBN16_06490 [Plesiomonas shigelloides]KAB7684471.1 hypothetical protein GBN20_15190 [Plesiomonas shigelloides]KAB7689613.1 hypothetical protein GBN24_10580 [Plesiomonas shigelloides]MCX2533253.1 hypothetical protein [Plesiomonas shigelloides]